MTGTFAQSFTFSRNDGTTILLTVKPHAVNLFTRPQNDLWTFDLEGRLMGMYVNGVNYRRTLSNRFYLKDRISIDGEDYRNVTPIGLRVAGRLLAQAHRLFHEILPGLDPDARPLVEKILLMDMGSLKAEGKAFDDIYLPISILPPDQYMSLVIQITEGCNYNRCTFCNFYRDRPFKIKNREEISLHLDQVLAFFGEGVRLRKSIFLADANALVTPQSRLRDTMELIRRKTGKSRNIYSFIDVFTGIKKSSKDFSDLAALGLNRVYLGVESGDPELLAFLHKPQATDDIVELTENLKLGGVNLGVIFLTGAGGEKYHSQHLDASINLLEKIPLGKGDMIYLSEFYETNPQYEYELTKHGIFQPDRQEIRKMTMEFLHRFQKFTPTGAVISPYDIQQFLY